MNKQSIIEFINNMGASEYLLFNIVCAVVGVVLGKVLAFIVIALENRR